MSLISRLFGSKDTQAAETPPTDGREVEVLAHAVPSASPPIPVTLEMLGQLFPIRNLDEEEVSAFAIDRYAEALGAGTELFQRGTESRSLFYLLDGSVRMDLGEGKSYEIEAHTAKARFPLCSGRRYSATARALSDVQILRVSPQIMRRNVAVSVSPLDAHEPHDDSIPANIRSLRLFQAFHEHYRGQDLVIPTLPDVAIKLRQAVENHEDIKEIVKIIQIDPAVTAKLVHVANSPLYLPMRPITRCHDAVVRLGLQATRSLVIGYTLRQVFKGKDPFINKRMREEWKRSVYLSSLCYVLAAENDRFDQEEALLAGLLCDIGAVPFLHFTENFPREYWSPEDVDTLMPWLRGPVGAYVLERWNFQPELVEIPRSSEEWFHDGGPVLTLGDIVILSKLHSYIGTPRMSELPAINSIPAYGKLKNGQLSPEHTLDVLHQARDKIAEIMKLFGN